MKKISFIIMLCVAVFTTSCDKDTEGVSKITTYATVTLEGDNPLFWELNTPFVDPGYSAFEGETDITDQIIISGSPNVNKAGVYTISYLAENSDGFAAGTSRTVYVYDETAPLNGYYESGITRTYNGATAKRGPFPILLFGTGNNQYYIEDLLGGWYYIGSNYGASYAGNGIIKIEADNSISIVSSAPLAWGYPCVLYDAAGSVYDSATGQLTLKVIMADTPSMLFDVTLSNPSQLK
jgi:hypothetical protein